MVPVVALPPGVPSTSQLTPPFAGSLVTVAVNGCGCDSVTDPRTGLNTTVSTPCVTVIVAGAVFVTSAIDLTVRVTVAGTGTVAGAV